jgi:hypothetical protein
VPPGIPARVTGTEQLFDLVTIFAASQLSGYFLTHLTPTGTLTTAILISWLPAEHPLSSYSGLNDGVSWQPV